MIHGEAPKGIVKLGLFMMACSVLLAGAANRPTLIFPQFANGEVNGLPNRSRFILRNNGPEMDTGTIRFLDGNGNPVAVPVSGSETETIDFEMSPWSTLDFESDGTGALITGSVVVCSDLGAESRLEGSLVFEILGSKVSVGSSPTRSTNQVYVSRTPNENAGIAVFNPDQDDSVELELHLSDAQGTIRASKFLDLKPLERFAGFVDDDRLFADFFAQTTPSSATLNQGGETFTGTLNVINRFSGGPLRRPSVSVVGLLQDPGTGALTAQSTSSNANHLVKISNLEAGPSDNTSSAVDLPLRIDFQDPTGSINSSERIRVFFDIDSGAVAGFTSFTPSGLPAEQRSGTLPVDLTIFGINFTPGLTLSIEVTIETERGNTSNTLSGSFETAS